MIREDIIEYVEREVIPRYDAFDKAHRRDHVQVVIEQSLKLAGSMPEVDPEMAYVVAAFHDLGLVNGRENHHLDSGKILRADKFILNHFSPEQIKIMADAVEDHRASNGRTPRNVYGLIVAEADRQIVPETIIRRTIQYGLAHYPTLDYNGHYKRTIQHLKEKSGDNRYLNLHLHQRDNARRLQELHTLLADESSLRSLIARIFEEETR